MPSLRSGWMEMRCEFAGADETRLVALMFREARAFDDRAESQVGHVGIDVGRIPMKPPMRLVGPAAPRRRWRLITS